jgi:hypothetical protein
MNSIASRVDSTGLAYKGSQLQTQLYVNALPGELSRACRAAVESLPDDAVIEWRSPLRSAGYAEFRDAAFLRAVGLEHLGEALTGYWPGRGPRWDALAVVKSPSLREPGVILGEGKSYPEELRSATRARGESRLRIGAAIADTQTALGAPVDPESWMHTNYQIANRLAHLVWLHREGIQAWFLQLLFVDDPHRPTSITRWGEALRVLHADLGLDSHPAIGAVPLTALPRDLLAA